MAGHLPSIGIENAGGKLTVKVITPHEMKGYEHYIVKHVLLDKNYKFIDEHLFQSGKRANPNLFIRTGKLFRHYLRLEHV